MVVNFLSLISLFTVNFSHLHYNAIQRGLNYKIARNYLAYMLAFIVMQMSKVNTATIPTETPQSDWLSYRIVYYQPFKPQNS